MPFPFRNETLTLKRKSDGKAHASIVLTCINGDHYQMRVIGQAFSVTTTMTYAETLQLADILTALATAADAANPNDAD